MYFPFQMAWRIMPLLLAPIQLPLSACDAVSAEALRLGRPIAFAAEAVRGSELIQKSPATILIGETHGTWETPLLVATLVRSASSEMMPTILCLEIPSTEQQRLDEFLQSDGGDSSIAKLIAGSHWSRKDGLASIGYFGLLELMRRLNEQGRNVHVVAIDIDPQELIEGITEEAPMAEILEAARKRDLVMANAILAARNEFPASNLFVLAGNVHTRVRKGAPWDAEYVPMSWHVSQHVPDLVSLEVVESGGQAWVTTEKDTGEKGTGPINISGPDRGETPFVELFDAPKDGYHGVFYVGKVTAARPVRKAP